MGFHHPNKGKDIIQSAYDMMIDAVLQPDSADGTAITHGFHALIRFRIGNALRKTKTFEPFEEPIEHSAIEHHIDLQILVERLEPRPKQAFELFHEGYNFREIGKHMTVSEHTARRLVREAQGILSSHPTVQEMIGSLTSSKLLP